MFSRGTQKYIRLFYKLGTVLRLFPFRWSNETNSLEVCSKIHGYYFLTIIIWFVLHCVKLWQALYDAVLHTTGISPGGVVLDIFFFVWMHYTLSASCAIWKSRHVLAALINEIYRVDQQFALTMLPLGSKNRDYMEFLIPLLTPSCFSGGICFTSFLIFNPLDRKFPTAWLSLQRSSPLFIIAFLWETYASVVAWYIAYVYWFLLMPCCQACSSWLKEMAMKASRSEMNSEQLYNQYRTLERLQREFNAISRFSFIVPFKILNVVNHSFIIYALVTLHGSMNVIFHLSLLMTCGIWTFIELFTYSMAGGVFQAAKNFIRVYCLSPARTAPKASELKRCYQRALRPFGVEVGNVYCMKKETPLLILTVVITSATNLILMTW